MPVCSDYRVLNTLHSDKQLPATRGPQSRSALFGDEGRFLYTPGIELRSVGHLSHNLITVLTELSVTLILYLRSTCFVSQSCSWHSSFLVWRLRVQALLRTPAVVTRYLCLSHFLTNLMHKITNFVHQVG